MASLPDAATAAATSLLPPLLQPNSSWERLVPPSSVTQQPPLPVADHVHLEVPYEDVAPPNLHDVSKVVRTRVAQHLQGTPAPFLLTDEDSPMDEDASPTKRRRCSIKSGRLRTCDTHVLHRIKLPHEMVCSAQSKAPVYEEMLLASFSNGSGYCG